MYHFPQQLVQWQSKQQHQRPWLLVAANMWFHTRSPLCHAETCLYPIKCVMEKSTGIPIFSDNHRNYHFMLIFVHPFYVEIDYYSQSRVEYYAAVLLVTPMNCLPTAVILNQLFWHFPIASTFAFLISLQRELFFSSESFTFWKFLFT